MDGSMKWRAILTGVGAVALVIGTTTVATAKSHGPTKSQRTPVGQITAAYGRDYCWFSSDTISKIAGNKVTQSAAERGQSGSGCEWLTTSRYLISLAPATEDRTDCIPDPIDNTVMVLPHGCVITQALEPYIPSFNVSAVSNGRKVEFYVSHLSTKPGVSIPLATQRNFNAVAYLLYLVLDSHHGPLPINGHLR
jgi:hypothetical protein